MGACAPIDQTLRFRRFLPTVPPGKRPHTVDRTPENEAFGRWARMRPSTKRNKQTNETKRTNETNETKRNEVVAAQSTATRR